MNYPRLFLAAFGSFVAYFAAGGAMFVAMPWMKTEFMKYPTIYRTEEGIKSVMPAGMGAMFIGILMLAALYAHGYRGGPGLEEGALFGALIGVFVVCAFVVHNWVNLNIGWKITVMQAVAYFVEWLVVGIVIGLLYRLPAPQ